MYSGDEQIKNLAVEGRAQQRSVFSLCSRVWTWARRTAPFFILLVGWSAASAQDGPPKPAAPQAPAEAAISTRANDQTHIAMAYNSNNHEYLVVYQDANTVTDHDILGRLVDSAGNALGSELYLVSTQYVEELHPDVAYDPATGYYLVVWEYEIDINDSDIIGRMYDASGSPVGSGINIAVGTTKERFPSVAYNNGEFLVAFEYRTGSDEFAHYDIHARRVSSGGALLGSEITVASGLQDDLLPDVAAGQGYLVAWQTEQAGGVYFDIHSQRLDSAGNPLSSELTTGSGTYDQVYPSAAYHPGSQKFLVAWEDHDLWGGTVSGIYGQMVNADGSLSGGNFSVATSYGNNRFSPQVVYQIAANEFLAVYEFEYDSSDHDIFAQRVAGDGTLLEAEQHLTYGRELETHPAVAPDGSWQYLYAWEDDRDAGTQGIDIYGELFSLYQFSGRVFAGSVGNETSPIPDVYVDLYCSDSADSLGTLVDHATTQADGWYGLLTADYCAHYHLVESDPSYYTPAGATSISGEVVDENHIRFTNPLAGQDLTGNKFWDYPPDDVTTCSSCSDCTSKLHGDYGLVKLSQDIVGSAGACVLFDTNHAVFDCQGYSITGQDAEEFSAGVRMVGSSGNTVRNCTITGFETGIDLQTSNYASLISNTLTANKGPGIRLESSANNQLKGNQMTTNQDGVKLMSANNNAFSGNTICKSKWRDIYAPLATSGNTRSGDKCDYIYNWNDAGDVQECDTVCTPPITTYCSSGTECLASLNGDYGTVILNGDLAIPGGLAVGGNHLALDCNGHRLDGTGSGAGVVLDNKVGVTVRNCTIAHFGTGVELRSAVNNTIQSNIINNNNTGIALLKTDAVISPQGNTVSGNTVTQNAYYGLHLNDAQQNTISNNNFQNNTQYSVWLSGPAAGCDNTLTANTGGNGGAIQYWHDIPVAGTLASGSYDQAILCNVGHATLENLRIDNGGAKSDGISLFHTSNTHVRSSTITNTNGIALVDSSHVSVYNNKVSFSKANGIDLLRSASASIYGNTVQRNPGSGLYMETGSGSAFVYNNTFYSNTTGVDVDSSSSISLTNNTLRENKDEGIAFANSSNNGLAKNSFIKNGFGLYFANDTSYTVAKDNNVCYNTSSDIYNNGLNNTGSGNTCLKTYHWQDAGAAANQCSARCIGWYPYNYGLKFHNPSKDMLSFGCPYDACQGDYTDTFGRDAVYHSVDVCIGIPLCLPFVGCYCLGYEAKIPTPVPDGRATAWYFAAYAWAARPGECTGMSRTSLMFQHGAQQPSKFNSAATKVSDLEDTGSLEDQLDSGQGAIMSTQIIEPYLSWFTFHKLGGKNAVNVLNDVKQSIQNKNLGSIIIHSLTEAHNVVATDVRDYGNTARIYIYDSNAEKWSTQFSSNENDYPYITIDKVNNTFSTYSSSYSGFYSIWFLPYSTLTGGFNIPLSSYDGTQFLRWGVSTSSVEDGSGSVTGWQGGQVVNDIPGAVVMPSWGEAPEAAKAHDHYFLPPGDYTAHIQGDQSGSYNALVLHDNSLVTLNDVPANEDTQDTLEFQHEAGGPATPHLVFQSSDATKPYSMTIAETFDASGTVRYYSIKNAEIGRGTSAVFSISPDYNSLLFTNRGSTPVVYTVEMQNSMVASQSQVSDTLPTARREQVSIPPNTTQVLTPQDWLHLADSTVQVSEQACGDKACSLDEDALSCPEDCGIGSCVTPHDDLAITANTRLCPGDYSIPDGGSPGVLHINANNITLQAQGVRLVGDGQGVGITSDGRQGIVLQGGAVQSYTVGVRYIDVISGSIRSAALLGNQEGVLIDGGRGSLVQNNVLQGNKVGLHMVGSNAVQVNHSLACGNEDLDIWRDGGANALGSGNMCQAVQNWYEGGVAGCSLACEGGKAVHLFLPMMPVR